MLKRRLMDIMDGEQNHPIFSAATFLWGASQVYGTLARLRRWGYEQELLTSHKLPCPVISVGNLAVGGTGKTPMVVHLAGLIGDMGCRVAVISRGYKGTAQKRGAIVSDGCTLMCNERQSGDEPYLMAMLLEKIPVVVGRDRWAAGKMAFDRFKPDILLLDDAYQHLRLKRDLNLLLLDARRPFGNSHLLPRGRLREPTKALTKADAVILTRSEKSAASSRDNVASLHPRVPVFRSVHKPVVRGLAPANKPLPPLNNLSGPAPTLNGSQVFVFAGLAHNRSFIESLARLGCTVKGAAEFDDHHHYHQGDIQHIAAAATASGAVYCITTDKDYVRLSNQAHFPMDVIIMGVETDFQGDQDSWHRFIKEQIDSLIDKIRQ